MKKLFLIAVTMSLAFCTHVGNASPPTTKLKHEQTFVKDMAPTLAPIAITMYESLTFVYCETTSKAVQVAEPVCQSSCTCVYGVAVARFADSNRDNIYDYYKRVPERPSWLS